MVLGSDLQYIRINGTIVGALVGCAIYLLSFDVGRYELWVSTLREHLISAKGRNGTAELMRVIANAADDRIPPIARMPRRRPHVTQSGHRLTASNDQL